MPHQEIEKALRTFIAPGQVSNLRAVLPNSRGADNECFSDMEAMAKRALEWERSKKYVGIYFTLNPVRPDMVGRKVGAKKIDIVERHWFPVDIDAIRTPGTSATDHEREQAWMVLNAVQGTMESVGMRSSVIGDSGNGWHNCYPILLPNDDASQELTKNVLKGLSQRCDLQNGETGGRIDCSCHDAPRIWKLYGTTARKGEPTAERPHRIAWKVSGDVWNEEAARHNTPLLTTLLERWKWVDDMRKGRPTGDVIDRAKAYIATMPPAIQGEDGSSRCFNVACVLVKDFSLSVEEALVAIAEWNRTCQPPWSEKELRHKLTDALKKEGPRGKLLGDVEPEPVFEAKPEEPPASGEEPKKKPPLWTPIPASQLKMGEGATWLWKGYLSRGGITLLSALWKAGKTTLLAHLLVALEKGGEFCGQELDPAKVLFVSEESEPRWAERRDKLGLKDHVEFLIRPFGAKPQWKQWTDFLTYMSFLVQSRGYELIVFDTLINLWPVKDENDAGQVQSALMPLHKVAEKASLLLVHHNRKGGGEEATASRGSGALTAFVDTIVELRRFDANDRGDRRRMLSGYGRYDETPAELVIELDAAKGKYTAQGAPEDIKRGTLADILRPHLPSEAPGVTFNDLMALWPEDTPKPQKSFIYEALQRLVDDGEFIRDGEGVRGNPHRYRKP